MRRIVCLLSVLALGITATTALADEPIRLKPFPAVTTADGRSTVQITAQVRDADGRPVPDGTRVSFETTLGKFRESLVPTSQGVAQAILVAPSTPGTAVITATSGYVGSAANTMSFTFLASRDELKAYKDYIEISSNSSLTYTPKFQMYLASAPNAGVSIKYQNIEIVADDVQIDLSDAGRFQVRARQALLKVGKRQQKFEALYYVLNSRMGVGLGEYKTHRAETFSGLRGGLVFMSRDPQGKWEIAPEVERFGMVDIVGDTVKKSKVGVGTTAFDFRQIDQSENFIQARKIYVIPGREIQFRKAEIYVQGQKTVHLPLFDLKTNESTNNLATANALTVSDNQVQLNYPQYLSLKPGLASLVRLQSGEVDSADGVHRGLFADYELSWDHADQMNGGLTVTGLTNGEYVVGLREQLRANERNTLTMDVGSPKFNGFIGQAGIESQQDGYSAHASADSSQTFQGIEYSEKHYQAGVDLAAIPLGKLPFTITPGIAVQRMENSLLPDIQQGYGVQLTGQSKTLHIDRATLLTTGFSIGHFNGTNEVPGLALGASLFVNRSLSRSANIHFGYSYSRQGIEDIINGDQTVTAGGSFSRGNTSLFFDGEKSLTVAGDDLTTRLAYRESKLWNLTTTYQIQRISDERFLDYGLGFTYRLGVGGVSKDVGLMWNYRTHGIGLQFFDPNNF